VKVVVPKKADGVTSKIVYYNDSLSTTKDATDDLYNFADNIIFANNLVEFHTVQPVSSKVGDIYHNTDDDKVYMYCSDGTWKDTNFDGWGTVPNFLINDKTLPKVYRDYLNNGGTYVKSTCDNVISHFPIYDKDTDYTAGDIVEVGIAYVQGSTTSMQSMGVPYKCLTTHAAADGAKDPLTEPTYWERLPFYNQLALYDKFINTKANTKNQDLNLQYGFNGEDISDIDFAAILNPKGSTAKFIWENSSTSKEVDIDLTYRKTSNFNQYFFNKFNYRTIAMSSKELINIDKLTIKLNGDNNEASGVITGKSYDIGTALYGYQKQSRDFSKKVTTQDGYDYLQPGNKTKKLIVKLSIHNDMAQEVFETLQALSSTLCLYVLEDGEWVFGWYKDLYMVKQNPVLSEYNLEINGVI